MLLFLKSIIPTSLRGPQLHNIRTIEYVRRKYRHFIIIFCFRIWRNVFSFVWFSTFANAILSLSETEENGSPSLTSKADSLQKNTGQILVTEKLSVSHENVTSESSMDTTSTSTSPTSRSSPRTGETNSTTTTRCVYTSSSIVRLSMFVHSCSSLSQRKIVGEKPFFYWGGW